MPHKKNYFINVFIFKCFYHNFCDIFIFVLKKPGFGDNGELDFIQTKWDRKVDENSINPGRQTFEKMISGMYMGELIRQVIVDLMKDDLIFFNCNREKLLERGNYMTLCSYVYRHAQPN